MTCKKFEKWLVSEDDDAGDSPPETIALHLDTCDSCRNMLSIDRQLDRSIRHVFAPQDLPDGIMEKIDVAVDAGARNASVPWKAFVSAAATMCVAGILFLAYFQFSASNGRFDNLQQLSLSAVSRHLGADTTMSFSARDITAGVAALSRQLNFNVILPDLSSRQFTLLGGRRCVLSRCETAYLLYEHEGKTCSLFILDYDRFDFKMADGSRFSNEIKGCRTDIWKENGQVYALVY